MKAPEAEWNTSPPGGPFPTTPVDDVMVEVSITGPGPDVPVGMSDPNEPTKVRVRKNGFEITPKNLVVQGGNAVPLKVVLTDNSNPLDSTIFDYEFVWETPGVFGLFAGVSATVSSSNSNSVTYECLEDEENGTETVSVSIYSKFKDDPGPFEFEDKVSTTIEINNDPNRKIFYVTNSTTSDFNKTGIFYNWVVFNVYRFEPIENAIDYRLTVIENDPDAIPSYIGTSSFWVHGNPDDLEDGFYVHRTNFNAASGPFEDSARSSYQEALARFAAIRGVAKVVVNLKPEE